MATRPTMALERNPAMQLKTLAVLALLLVLGGLVATYALMGARTGVAVGVSRAAAPTGADDALAESALEPPEPRASTATGAGGASVPAIEPTASGARREEVRGELDDGARASRIALRAFGRVVDGGAVGGGVGLIGARVRCDSPRTSAESGVEGRFDLELEVDAARLGGAITLHVQRDGYVPLEVQRDLPSRDARTGIGAAEHDLVELDLGELVLVAAGTVSGKVVDEWGNGVFAARIVATTMGPLGWGARGAGPEDGLGEVSSEADGTFRLAGLPQGEVRVWAGADEHWWAYSDRVEVVRGGETRDVRLRLQALEPEDVIELLVLDPEEQPLAGATIQYFYHEDGRSGSGSANTDSDGKYRRILERRARFDFSARDPQGRYRPAEVRGVAPGTRDVVLRLGPSEVITVEVRDTNGGVVPDFSVRTNTVAGDGRFLQGEGKTASDPGQESVTLQLPAASFHITVVADGYESSSQGPLDPDEIGPVLSFELAPLPGVRGRVVDAAGKPVEGAEVSVHEALETGRRLTVNGFPARSQQHATASDTSDSDGEFTLSLRESGMFYLRAAKDGFAPGEIGPLDLSATTGARGLEVALSGGGSLAGQVLLPAGKSAAGLVVGVSRADGFAVTTRTDARGEYRFDGLTPGQWFVKRCGEEIRPGWTTSSSGSGDGEQTLPWSCEVWADRTTRFDLDLSEAAAVVLEGRLLLGGRPYPSMSVRLRKPGEERESVADAKMDSQGEFLVELSTPGKFIVEVTGFLDAGFTVLEEEVELTLGATPWARDLPLGVVEGTVAGPALVEDGQLSLRWEKDGLRYSSYSTLGEDGSFGKRVPAGEVRVGYGDLPGRSVQVTSGQTTRVDLP